MTLEKYLLIGLILANIVTIIAFFMIPKWEHIQTKVFTCAVIFIIAFFAWPLMGVVLIAAAIDFLFD